MTQVRGDIPEKIGRYEILEAVGYGAMGAVYKGFDPIIQRPVALKTLRLDIPPSSPDYRAFLERFAGEAKSVGRLSHPNIVTLYDVGAEEQPPWLAMEYVDGRTVAELLETERLRPELVVGLVSQIASAIDYAHSEGVVHRDIKPSNVIVCGVGKVKVTDFGIAKLMDADATHSGIMMGTPSYMSPEQAMGEDLDGRTDIFSLGVVAFEMLSGQQPFPGNNVTSILYKLVHADPVQPADLEVLGLLPHKWHEVFSRVLAKDPAERYPTAAAFVQDLELCLGSWFGALEGAAVVPREGDGKAPADRPAAPREPKSSEETVAHRTETPGGEERGSEETVRADVTGSPPEATFTMAGTRAGGPTPARPAGSNQTVRVPPASAAEQRLYEASGEETVAEAAEEMPLDAPPPPTATMRASSWGRRTVPVLVAALIGVALVASAILLRKSDVEPETISREAPAPTPAVEEPALPAMGSLRVATEPEGAVVYLDGRRAGLTPLDFPQIPLDTYVVRVELEGFLPQEVTTDLTPEATEAEYDLVLAPAPRQPAPAFLGIDSEPSGAEVQIDGRSLGPTPIERARVEPGARGVRVLLEGFLPWEDTVRVREGRTESILAVLTPRGPVPSPAPPPEPPSRERVRPGQLVERGEPGVVEPECVSCPSVPYPAAAREARLEGLVELDFLIDENGNVRDVTVVRSGCEVFDAAVVEVVRRWRYRPATKEGVPVQMRWSQRFRFQQGR